MSIRSGINYTHVNYFCQLDILDTNHENTEMLGPDFDLNFSEQWFHFSELILEALAKFCEWVQKLISSSV